MAEAACLTTKTCATLESIALAMLPGPTIVGGYISNLVKITTGFSSVALTSLESVAYSGGFPHIKTILVTFYHASYAMGELT